MFSFFWAFSVAYYHWPCPAGGRREIIHLLDHITIRNPACIRSCESRWIALKQAASSVIASVFPSLRTTKPVLTLGHGKTLWSLLLSSNPSQHPEFAQPQLFMCNKHVQIVERGCPRFRSSEWTWGDKETRKAFKWNPNPRVLGCWWRKAGSVRCCVIESLFWQCTSQTIWINNALWMLSIKTIIIGQCSASRPG